MIHLIASSLISKNLPAKHVSKSSKFMFLKVSVHDPMDFSAAHHRFPPNSAARGVMIEMAGNCATCASKLEWQAAGWCLSRSLTLAKMDIPKGNASSNHPLSGAMLVSGRVKCWFFLGKQHQEVVVVLKESGLS